MNVVGDTGAKKSARESRHFSFPPLLRASIMVFTTAITRLLPAAPIGSGLGIRNPANLRIILETVEVPVIVDAGVGTASDACITMEQGVDGILMNTALAAAEDPVLMARAMRQAVQVGRAAWLAGRMPKREWAVPSSPSTGMLE